MELQQKKFSCGPSAIRAALYMLGHNVTEAALRKHAGTTTEGTDEKGMIKAIYFYGHTAKEYQSTARKEAWVWLRESVSRGRPVLICVDQWGHWMAVVGSFGAKLLVFDPERSDKKRKRYSGLIAYTEEELGSRWRHKNKGPGRASYYGISITT